MRKLSQEGKTGGREKEMCLLPGKTSIALFPEKEDIHPVCLPSSLLTRKGHFTPPQTNGRELTR
jgi:hypothetical protein